LPPLRERVADVMPLAIELLMQSARREPRLGARLRHADAAARVLENVRESLSSYAWPGNVRELQNVIERIAVELADTDSTERLPPLSGDHMRYIAPEMFKASGDALSLRERSRHGEADEIRAALALHGGDRDAVCKALGISKTTLWRKLNGGSAK
jgi:propionate catabolism operon transcriptional regulator